MKKRITFLIILAIFAMCIVGCSSEKPIDVEEPKHIESKDSGHVEEIKYTLELEDSRYMSFYINNNTNKEIKLEYPSTHTFDFRLIKDGNVVWDSFKNDKTVAKEDWKTTSIINANGKLKQMIWYENIDIGLNGEYEYEFYSTNDNLKVIPHLTGKIEFLKDKYKVDRVKLIN